MTLPLYSVALFFPGGNEAANWPVPISVRASNQDALVFADAAGDEPLDNPVTTDSMGVASFYAAPGDYVAFLAGEFFQVQVDESETEPVYPGLYVHEQATPATAWIIAHHFGVEPAVDVLLAGEATEGAVSHTDAEHTVITFGSAVAGTAHLRR